MARLCQCGQCWAGPGQQCADAREIGDHLARYVRAYRRGLISVQDLQAVMGTAGEGCTPATMIPAVVPEAL
jgi:hypothetical protein